MIIRIEKFIDVFVGILFISLDTQTPQTPPLGHPSDLIRAFHLPMFNHVSLFSSCRKRNTLSFIQLLRSLIHASMRTENI